MNNLLDAVIAAKLAGGGGGGGGTGLTEEFKQALLNAFENVGWKEGDGREFVDALEAAMYPLSYITAVYTQSGTVYDTDSLDSLRVDLVVTATYDNGDVRTVTDYTLSGTLTEGTSTITVSYGGKTTTFDVVVTGVAPVYSLENAIFNNERFVTDVYPFINGDANLTILMDITFDTMPTSGNGSKVMLIRMTNDAGTTNTLALGKEEATNNAYRLWWMGTVGLTIGKATVGRFRVALVHEIGSNSLRCKVHNADGTTNDQTATKAFVASIKRFGIGGAASGELALPTGTVNAVYIYDTALSDSAIDSFLGLGGE